MKKLSQFFLQYVITDRQSPEDNRKRVGQNLMLLTIFLFSVFLINFAIIIGTDQKFGKDLSEGASQVYQLQVTAKAKRGTIYDRNGNPIAEDSTTYSVYAIMDKSYVDIHGNKLYVQESQFKKVAKIFKEHLDLEEKYVIDQLSQKDLSQTAFGVKGNNLSYSTMSAITEAMKKAKISGVSFNSKPGRMYGNGAFASHFIGLAQLVENEKDGTESFVGTTGMELALNDVLSGEDGIISYEKDKNGNVLLGAATTIKEPVDGKDVYTTLSEPLQITLETQMDALLANTGAKYLSATLVKADTGEILATSQRPTYNADTREGLTEENLGTFNTILYQQNFEPGSTMKVFTLASAIDRGVFNPYESYYSDRFEVADAVVRDWDVNDGRTEGNYLTMAQGFAHSSNVGMVRLEHAMGHEGWLEYLDKFKFGVRTRFGLGNEATGSLPDNNIFSISTSSFGQGINVSQIQMLRGFTAISNDGKMLEPHFISQIYDPNTVSSRVAAPEIIGNPISKKAASQTRDYMVTVGTDPQWGSLHNKGTGLPIITVNNESVAVKSGTAEIAQENGGGYLQGENDYINSVIAMVPTQNPEFLMYVTVQQPQSWDPVTAWEGIFTPVLEEAMLMSEELNTPVVPQSNKVTSYEMPDLIGDWAGDTADLLRRNILHPVLVGDGEKIEKVSVKKGQLLNENEQVLLLTDELKLVPEMYGWTKKNMDIFADWQGIEVTYKGKGKRVVKQSVKPGSKMLKTKKITITLGE